MIRRVGREQATWDDRPGEFEAGAPAITEAVALGAAGMDQVWAHEQALAAYALQGA